MKKLTALILALILCLALTACGQSDTAAPAEEIPTEADAVESAPAEEAAEELQTDGFVPALDTDAEVTIHVIGSYDNFPSLDTVAADFAEYYPNVTVSYEKLDDYNNVVAERVVGNTDVDIYMMTYTQMTTDEYMIGAADDLVSVVDTTQLDAGVLATNLNDD